MSNVFEIDSLNSRIDNYEDILSKFSNWKKYKREINLSLLLEEGKKIQFDVEITNQQNVFYVSVFEDEKTKNLSSLINVCATINKFTFIICNHNVIKLNVLITTIDTKWGKIIRNLIDSGIELKLNQSKNIKNQVDKFYFEIPKVAA